MNSDVQHVCFDKDGTLIDVHASWVPITRRRAQKIIQAYSLSEDVLKDACRIMGVDVKTKRILSGGPVGYKPRAAILVAVESWLKVQKVSTSMEQLAEIFRAVDVDVQNAGDFNASALPGVIESIKRLSTAGLKISIYTSDRHKNTDMVLSHLGIGHLIDAIIAGDDVQNPKPDPEGFHKACARVGVESKGSVYVGDTVDDMIMARHSGALGVYGITQISPTGY
jgi:phosphoglycolate phosphatase-like HAD superfamily hydrolase